MDLSEQDWERLDRLVSRQGSPDELAALERWVQGRPDLRALADAMRAVGQPAGEPAVHASDADAAWRRFSRRMRWFGRPALNERTWWSVDRWVRWSVAAVVMLAVGAGLMLIEVRSRIERERTISAAPARHVVTHRGERAAFTLADGSRVMLGAESRLTIPAAFAADGSRELYLDGEAYFEVVHDSLHPFQVHTPLGTAEDLGTEFVVSTYPEARGMRVVVASGAVALRQRRFESARDKSGGARPLLTLRPGDLAQLDSAGTATISRVDPSVYVASAQGSLAFDATPLREVLPQLARWYDLEIRLADSALAARRLTATFRGQSADQVLDLITLSLGLRMERQGRSIVFSSSTGRP